MASHDLASPLPCLATSAARRAGENQRGATGACSSLCIDPSRSSEGRRRMARASSSVGAGPWRREVTGGGSAAADLNSSAFARLFLMLADSLAISPLVSALLGARGALLASRASASPFRYVSLFSSSAMLFSYDVASSSYDIELPAGPRFLGAATGFGSVAVAGSAAFSASAFPFLLKV